MSGSEAYLAATPQPIRCRRVGSGERWASPPTPHRCRCVGIGETCWAFFSSLLKVGGVPGQGLVPDAIEEVHVGLVVGRAPKADQAFRLPGAGVHHL